MSRISRAVFILAAIAGIAVAVWTRTHKGRSSPHTSELVGSGGVAGAGGATFVGASVCFECHASQASQWRESMHARAMQPPSPSSVEAPFAGERFTAHGVTSTFSRSGSTYVVRTDAADGRLQGFEVAFTFGVSPLQQYLLPTGKGRLQALSVAWDARPAAEGGQRWFHLYPSDPVRRGDVLHWTSPSQNWNSGCAECHSTNLRKNYRAETDTYETAWSDVNVACEACHGAGSRHVAWARQPSPRPPLSPDSPDGLVPLGSRDAAAWSFDPSTGIAHRDRPRASHVEVEMCARCHARRAPLTDTYVVGRPLADTHRPALLDEGLYFADGQIQDEVFEYASFVQSRMYAQGVTCSDCHDPHRPEIRIDPNEICSRCHLTSTFATPAHHHHAEGSEGSRCVACHMPARSYMRIDPRRDHSFRIPRPDLSVKIGTPNACTGCHRDKPATWAAAQTAAWSGPVRASRPHYAEALAAGRAMTADAEPRLVALVQDPTAPSIARATAITLVGRLLGPRSAGAVRASAADTDPLVRMAAAQVLGGLPPRERQEALLPLLTDPVRTVRIEAARQLAALPDSAFDDQSRARRAARLAEWIAAQQFNADTASAHVNLGIYYEEMGDLARAESEYQAARRLEPHFVPAAVNLADLYRRMSRDDAGERVLRTAISETPGVATLHYALGMLLTRRGERVGALAALQHADRLAPNDPEIAYALGVALYSQGQREAAVGVLERLTDAHGGHRTALMTLALYLRDLRQFERANSIASRVLDMNPSDSEALALSRDLARTRPTRR